MEATACNYPTLCVAAQSLHMPDVGTAVICHMGPYTSGAISTNIHPHHFGRGIALPPMNHVYVHLFDLITPVFIESKLYHVWMRLYYK